MVECYIDILSIAIKCSYYTSGFSNDFRVSPAKSSRCILDRYPLKIINLPNAYKLVWVGKNIDDVKENYKSIFKDTVLEFDIFVDNKNLFNFCKLDIDKTYLFRNKKNSFELLSSDFKLKTNEVFDGKLFGKILINLNDFDINVKNDFFINIPVIKSFWVVDIDDSINKTEYEFSINGNKIKFNKFEDNGHSFISESPIDLHEHGFYQFIIDCKGKNTEKQLKVIPPLSYDKVIGSKYISRCVVN